MDTDSQDKQHTGTSGDAGVNGVKNSSGPAQADGSPGSGYLDVRSVMTSVEAVVAGVGNIPEGLQVPRLGELPVEVQHITTEMVPLSLLITRLAEYSRAGLQDHIAELAAKPLPPALANGNVNGANGGPSNSAPQEDTSPESLEKKAKLLNFIQDLHSRWVKMLVIIEWSRNADEVSTLIDLRTHLANKLELYNTVFWDLVNVKREMAFARVPSPDIKTALEVLSTGTAHWMPDVSCCCCNHLQNLIADIFASLGIFQSRPSRRRKRSSGSKR